MSIEPDVFGLTAIVELLAQTRADLDCDLARVDHRIEPFADGKQQLQLIEVGFDRRLHVGILQFARDLAASRRARTMHLTERSGRSRVMPELGKFFLPVRSK